MPRTARQESTGRWEWLHPQTSPAGEPMRRVGATRQAISGSLAALVLTRPEPGESSTICGSLIRVLGPMASGHGWAAAASWAAMARDNPESTEHWERRRPRTSLEAETVQ